MCCVSGQISEMDISKQLHAYEVEYHVLQDEMVDAPTPSEDSDRLDKLEKSNVQLKKQNMDLLEKLQVCVVYGCLSVCVCVCFCTYVQVFFPTKLTTN